MKAVLKPTLKAKSAKVQWGSNHSEEVDSCDWEVAPKSEANEDESWAWGGRSPAESSLTSWDQKEAYLIKPTGNVLYEEAETVNSGREAKAPANKEEGDFESD